MAQVKTLKTYRGFGSKYQHWQCGQRYYIAEEFSDGVYHLYRSDAHGAKLSDNLIGHNTDGKTEAKAFCQKDKTNA